VTKGYLPPVGMAKELETFVAENPFIELDFARGLCERLPTPKVVGSGDPYRSNP
jgi:hypothetical protein